MQKLKMLLYPTMLLLGSCAQNTPDESFCTLASPIYMNKADKVVGDTARQVLSHDDVGHRLCGWPYAVPVVTQQSH